MYVTTPSSSTSTVPEVGATSTPTEVESRSSSASSSLAATSTTTGVSSSVVDVSSPAIGASATAATSTATVAFAHRPEASQISYLNESGPYTSAEGAYRILPSSTSATPRAGLATMRRDVGSRSPSGSES